MDVFLSREWPAVTLVVATLNEAVLMPGKLRETAALDYPREALQVVLVDGGSSDGTQSISADHAARHPGVLYLETTLANKARQINEALAHIRTPWVLVTDADARMPADTLRRLVRVALSDSRIAVVGTTVMPRQPYPLDAWHWRISNALRRVEHRFGRTTGLVVAPCYLFRRALLDQLPNDTIADDVHVACLAAQAGWRSALVMCDVEELRAATTLRGWLHHKVGRTAGYLREVFRFLPTASRMAWPMRTVFLWRAAALTIGPPIALALLVMLAFMAGPAVVAGVGGFVLAAGAIRGIPTIGRSLIDGAIALALPFWLVLITMTALVLHLFIGTRTLSPRTSLRTHETEARP